MGKLHIFVGDADDFFLNLAVYHLDEFLSNTTDPAYGGSIKYGRPLKGHEYSPFASNAELLREIATQIARNAPAAEPPSRWQY